MPALRKLLIANRGEIAVRIIRTCKERGIRTVAVYAEPDAGMPHVLMADEAYLIGPAAPRESYLRMDAVIDAARASGADAIHPGYGFLSENAEFAGRVHEAGLVFVGPPARSIEEMGDKTRARALAARAGVPVVPGTNEPSANAGEAMAACTRIGYPVLLKAAAGGGGKGIRIVRSEGDLPGAWAAAVSEAQTSFGDGRVYVEKYLEQPRHIEFQILADDEGTIVHLGERECSIQRRHQKIIEETPSAILDDALRKKMGETAMAAARACGYVNAGTVEFLVDRDGGFYFLEMNTRIQVEHPITEMRTGLDLVALQLDIAAGRPIPFGQDDIRFSGHAIECRICAEDPVSMLPDSGTITHLRPSMGPGVREDRGIEAGDAVSLYYDSLIAKLAVWAPGRKEAIAKMVRALKEYELLGVSTTIPICLSVLEHPRFVAGDYSTRFVEESAASLQRTATADRSVLAAAALAAWMEHRRRNAPRIAQGSGRVATQRTEDPDRWKRGWKGQRSRMW